MNKENQYRANVEELVDEYYNGITDGKEEPFTSETQYIEYILNSVFNMKVIADGFTKYGKGICDDLKFLGSAKLYDIAMEYAYDVMVE